MVGSDQSARRPNVQGPFAPLAIGVGFVVVAGAMATLRFVTLQPQVLPILGVAAVASLALLLRPAWIVPVYLALTWAAIGQGFFGGVSPVETGGIVLLALAAWRATQQRELASRILLIAALLGLPLLVAAFTSPEGIAIPNRQLGDLAFLPIAGLGLRGRADGHRLLMAFGVLGLVLGIGATLSILAGPSTLFQVQMDPLGDQAPRAVGAFGEPNFFALSLAALLPAALYLATRSGWRVPLGICSALAIAAGVLATGSRAGALTALGSLVICGVVTRSRGVRIGAVAVVAGTLAALPLFAAQSQSSEQRGIGGRLSENRIAVAMFADHPIAGVGPDRFKDLYRDYARRIGNDPRARRNAHSLPLEIAAEQGVVGFIGWLTALVLAVALALRRGAWEDSVARTFVLALATYLFGSLFLHGSQLRIIYMLLGAVLAMAFCPSAPRRGPAAT